MRITWDVPTERPYSQGVSQGVLYPENAPGVAWNGLISVTEAGDQDQEPKYFDGQKFNNRNRPLAFSGTISAFTYPEEFEPYIGVSGIFTAQPRKTFGFSYRANNEIHIVYNAMAAPSKRPYSAGSGDFDPIAFEWEFTTVPEKIPGGKPSSHLVILIDKSQPGAIDVLESAIYGDDENEPVLPPVEKIIEFFESQATLWITDHGDGTWTARGPAEAITIIDGSTFSINWASVIIINSDTFRVSSL